MLMGIKFQARPTKEQAQILCSWMGSAKTIWNAKCQEDKYLRSFAIKFLPLKTFPEINAQYAQYKDKELTPWLFDCPSQILRNSASNWYFSYKEFFKQKDRGRPIIKRKGQGMSINLTSELFEFKETEQGLKVFIGTKTNNIGLLDINWHSLEWQSYDYPRSITIKKLPSGQFTASFCYGEPEKNFAERIDRKEWLTHLGTRTEIELEKDVLGIDRGINISAATDIASFNPTVQEKRSASKYQRKLKKLQKKLAKKKNKKSKRREKCRLKIAKSHKKISDIRKNITHQITKDIVSLDKKIFILEDLRTKNMTKSSKGNSKKHGKNVRQKSGLNREILNQAWFLFCTFLTYKARLSNKVVFKINPQYTSQECADCGHIHPKNRLGIEFKCLSCGTIDHADTNAAKVIKKRAIKFFQNSGTELSDKGVLSLPDSGRGAKIRPVKGNPTQAQAKNSRLRKKRQKRRTVA